jgi:3-oxoacyl-[acyl-carrier protein] reductase
MTETLPPEIKKQLLASIPLGRTGLPHEVAEVVAFLATKGTYMTGSVVHVNGGLYGG